MQYSYFSTLFMRQCYLDVSEYYCSYSKAMTWLVLQPVLVLSPVSVVVAVLLCMCALSFCVKCTFYLYALRRGEGFQKIIPFAHMWNGDNYGWQLNEFNYFLDRLQCLLHQIGFLHCVTCIQVEGMVIHVAMCANCHGYKVTVRAVTGILLQFSVFGHT